MARVMIVDDHAVVRAGLRAILERELKQVTFGEASDAPSARAAFSSAEWDAVVLDLSIPGAAGLDLLKEFRRLRPQTPVIILSFHTEEEYAIRSLRAGAASYLAKECAAEELGVAIRQVLLGRRYVSPQLAERVVAELESGPKQPHEFLSDREYLILCELGSGKPLKQIALDLGLNIKTISTYRARVLRKMRLTSNTELIRYVMERHLS